ncbi:MAG TPA: hypothetical protein VFR35_09915 [Actinoplanes sp.]|nr:hypothetical protein [Actinoplanes sp.]
MIADGRPLAKSPAEVCLSIAGGALRCAATTTSSAGTVLVTRVATRSYQVKLVVPATPAAEAVAGWRVRAAVVARGSGRSLTVTITGVSGQTVQVQRHAGTRWTTIRTYRAATARRTVPALDPGRYRVVVPATSAFTGATSTAVRI